MNEHITADDREILDMLHDVIYKATKATNKEGDYDEWLLNKEKTIKTLTDILIGLIVNTHSDTAPPKREWVGLEDENLDDVTDEFYKGAVWAEAKLKEKNCGA